MKQVELKNGEFRKGFYKGHELSIGFYLECGVKKWGVVIDDDADIFDASFDTEKEATEAAKKFIDEPGLSDFCEE